MIPFPALGGALMDADYDEDGRRYPHGTLRTNGCVPIRESRRGSGRNPSPAEDIDVTSAPQTGRDV